MEDLPLDLRVQASQQDGGLHQGGLVLPCLRKKGEIKHYEKAIARYFQEMNNAGMIISPHSVVSTPTMYRIDKNYTLVYLNGSWMLTSEDGTHRLAVKDIPKDTAGNHILDPVLLIEEIRRLHQLQDKADLQYEYMRKKAKTDLEELFEGVKGHTLTSLQITEQTNGDWQISLSADRPRTRLEPRNSVGAVKDTERGPWTWRAAVQSLVWGGVASMFWVVFSDLAVTPEWVTALFAVTYGYAMWKLTELRARKA